MSPPVPIERQVAFMRSEITFLEEAKRRKYQGTSVAVDIDADLAVWRAVLLTLIEVQSRTVNA